MWEFCGLTREEIMNSTPSPLLGEYVQLAGVAALVIGAILSVHHYAIGLCIIAGATAFYVGKKIRGV
jgi:hypothetical protein